MLLTHQKGLWADERPLVPHSTALADKPLSGLIDFERQHILLVLASSNWEIEGVSGAEEQLKLAPSTLRNRIKMLGLQWPNSSTSQK
ncbi:MAG: hypothetical protein KC587_08770 [Nitrospira sp.]|nr:hypothetical protein [Nitrospira sp.]MCW5783672.1 hypothetical protein [Nitrospirales bacterium]